MKSKKKYFFPSTESNKFFARADQYNIRISALDKTNYSVMLRHPQ